MAVMSADEVARLFSEALHRSRSRDVAAGMTLQGPHRDDVLLSLNDLPAPGYASRAQQRTIALSMRLAEAQLLSVSRGETPVLLLDDVLSEMDASRRQSVLAAIGRVDQMLVTGTDWDRFPAEFVGNADLFAVECGEVRSINSTDHAGQTADS